MTATICRRLRSYIPPWITDPASDNHWILSNMWHIYQLQSRYKKVKASQTTTNSCLLNFLLSNEYTKASRWAGPFVSWFHQWDNTRWQSDTQGITRTIHVVRALSYCTGFGHGHFFFISVRVFSSLTLGQSYYHTSQNERSLTNMGIGSFESTKSWWHIHNRTIENEAVSISYVTFVVIFHTELLPCTVTQTVTVLQYSQIDNISIQSRMENAININQY